MKAVPESACPSRMLCNMSSPLCELLDRGGHLDRLDFEHVSRQADNAHLRASGQPLGSRGDRFEFDEAVLQFELNFAGLASAASDRDIDGPFLPDGAADAERGILAQARDRADEPMYAIHGPQARGRGEQKLYA